VAGRSWGMGQTQEERSGLRSIYRGGSTGPAKLKKISTANTEMQTAVIIGLLGCSLQLQPRDHSAAEARPRKWIEGYISIGTRVLPISPARLEAINHPARPLKNCPRLPRIRGLG